MTKAWQQFLNKVVRRNGSRGSLVSLGVDQDASGHGAVGAVASRQDSASSGCFEMDLQDSSTHGGAAGLGLDPQLGRLLAGCAPGAAGPGCGLGPTQQDDISSSSVSRRRQQAEQRRQESGTNNPMSVLYQLNSLMALSTFFEYKLSSDTARAITQISSSSSAASNSGGAGAASAVDVALLALVLSRWGYRVTLRRVTSPGTYWTKALVHSFLVVLDTSSCAPVEYVLDPNFKEAFRTGVMSGAYRAIWSSLPPVFLGMPCQLQPVVALLCEEVELSFLEAGRQPPPWRTAAATLGRWMSHAVVDSPAPPPAAPQGEVAAYLAAARTPQPAAAASSTSSMPLGADSACPEGPGAPPGAARQPATPCPPPPKVEPLAALHGFTPATPLPAATTTSSSPPRAALSQGQQQPAGVGWGAGSSSSKGLEPATSCCPPPLPADQDGSDSGSELGGIIYTVGSMADGEEEGEEEGEEGCGGCAPTPSPPSSVSSESLATAISPLPPAGTLPRHTAQQQQVPALRAVPARGYCSLDVAGPGRAAGASAPAADGLACPRAASLPGPSGPRPRSLLTEGIARQQAASAAALGAWGYPTTLTGGLDPGVVAGQAAAAAAAQELLRSRAHLAALKEQLLQQAAAQHQQHLQQAGRLPAAPQQQAVAAASGGAAGGGCAAGQQRVLAGLPQQPAIRVLRLLPQSAVGIQA